MMSSPLIHLLIFSLYPVISLYASNIYQVSYIDVVFPLLMVFISTNLFTFILFFFTRNFRFSALITSTFILSVFLYGPLNKLVGDLPILYHLNNSLLLSAILVFFFFLYLIFFLTKKINHLEKINRFYNILAIFLFIFPLLSFSDYFVADLSIKPVQVSSSQIAIDYNRPKDKLPDIYYLILDRYAASDTLLNIYQYDNSPFLQYLQDKGFQIINGSWANYYSSAHSIASSLNLNYLNELIKNNDAESKDWMPIVDLIQNQQLARILKKFGYRYYHFGSWWWPTSKNRLADITVNLGYISEFSAVLINNTVFLPLAREFKLPLIDTRYAQWRRIRYQLDKLPKVAEDKEPTFVFAHLIIPHEPFVFNAEGGFLTDDKDKLLDNNRKYLDQLVFLNSRLSILVNAILEKTPNSVIILQADEGPYPNRYENDKNNFDWEKAEKSEIDTKMSIFNAVYFPDRDYLLLNKISSPVNSFRLIINKFLKQNIPLLEERYYLGNMTYPYKILEIKKDK